MPYQELYFFHTDITYWHNVRSTLFRSVADFNVYFLIKLQTTLSERQNENYNVTMFPSNGIGVKVCLCIGSKSVTMYVGNVVLPASTLSTISSIALFNQEACLYCERIQVCLCVRVCVYVRARACVCMLHCVRVHLPTAYHVFHHIPGTM